MDLIDFIELMQNSELNESQKKLIKILESEDGVCVICPRRAGIAYSKMLERMWRTAYDLDITS